MGRRAWGEWQRAKKKMGETKEGLFGEAGDRQGPVCRDPILNEWGCIPEGGEEEGLKLCVCVCVVFFCLGKLLRECPRKLLETSSLCIRQLSIL